MSGNKVQNAVQHNAISDGIHISLIKTEQESSEGEYPVTESALTRDTRACSSASSTLNYVSNISDSMNQTQEYISEAIIKSEVLELPEELIIKEEEGDASEDHSQLNDIEAVYFPTVYKSEEFEYVEIVVKEEDINKYEKEEPENTIVMDTELSRTAVKKRAKADRGPKQCTSNRSNFTEEKQTSQKRFKCEQCGEIFLGGSSFRKHKSAHTRVKPFSCDHCDKTFLYRTDFIRHERTHTGEKPYKCDQCDKMFSRQGHLVQHKRTHTGEKPYKCDQCSKMFSLSGDLNIHKRIHTGKKPYGCDQCNKMFSRAGHLVQHKRTHTGEKPYKCDQCDKLFSRTVHLLEHKRTHTGEKPYKCDLCGNKFSRTSHLVKHKRTHTGEKPYKCDQCDKMFAQRSSLNMHKRTHTE